ncbi:MULTISPECIES: polysaccharide lyase family 7 protein [Vibrio]|uniref:polysaccharide lyase family 7 protein n=1 Tax=Vibrio TaxID=662 RepID=UPI00062F20D4|nr:MULTISPECIES: polysaccharide lyase family 7 protein [Vibrio]UPR31016.1 polysaccharide lyase family 7 protein [Vibrio crassostreae]CDU12546.1 putative alginate lyase [Vibrio coralliirubri]
MKLSYLSLLTASLLAAPALASNHDIGQQFNLDPAKAPAQNFDLSKWKINLPELTTEGSRKGKTLEIGKQELSNVDTPYVHPKWFYTDAESGAMVFVAPNTAPTTPNSKNTRSELRAMLADSYSAPSNNFAISSHENAEEFGSIGGQMTATLSVDQVSTSGSYKKTGAFSVVIGQIHGSDNEPLKIVYRKLPEHEHGSLTWNYELNPPTEMKDAKDENGKKLRKDIRHDVFGQYNLKKGSSDPADGIKLGEVFSYDVNIKDNIMHLTFTKNPNSADAIVKTYDVDLAKGKYQGHDIDLGYGQDWMYFKAGAYNQCNTKKSSSACEWRGMEAGDYTQASFYQLVLNQ